MVSEQVLLKAAEERQKALHTIRERVEKTCTWTLGVMLVIAGWAVDRKIVITSIEALFLFSVLLIAMTVIRGVYLRDLESGFRSQQRVLVQIEEALGLFDGVYPVEWRQAGSGNGQGRFFRATYALLVRVD